MIDVAIVGAGPAGAWAAWRLARAGARVTIFDASHPREKPCGGGVTARAMAIVAPALEHVDLPSVAIASARFETDAAPGEQARVSLDGRALAVVSRRAFDGALLDAAIRQGATLQRDRVTDVRCAADGVYLSTARGAHRASWAIGADGANSLVRRKTARPFSRAELSIGAGFFAHGVSSSEIVIRSVSDPPGYIWSFPRRDHLAIGICAQADAGSAVDALKQRTREWIAASGIARGATLEPYAWPIPSLTVESSASVRIDPRVLLVGDAAGLVDPITREGIFFALQSAGFAADALLARRDPAPVYAARIADEIAPELRRAASLKRGFFRPRFTRLLVHALAESARVRNVMADLIAGHQPYATLAPRLLRTLEIGLAWRLMKIRYFAA